jgi:heterodisulfide reductase subunit B
MRIGYYPGCSLDGLSRDFGESTVALAKALEIELVEVPDWNCCGSSSAHVMSHLLAVSLPASVLAKAAAAGLDEVLAPCAACYNRLVSARNELESGDALRGKVEGIIEAKLEKMPRILNILELLDRVKDRIAPRIKEPFAHTVACYYGCLLVRPPRVVKFDRAEDPTSMDALVKACGGKTVEWNSKTECCGAGMSMPRTSLVGTLGGRIVAEAAAKKAEAIVVACPMCHSNLDLRRGAIDHALGTHHALPVLFITQVVGMALGVPAKQLGLSRHFVPVALAKQAAAPVAS